MKVGEFSVYTYSGRFDNSYGGSPTVTVDRNDAFTVEMDSLQQGEKVSVGHWFHYRFCNLNLIKFNNLLSL